MMESTLSANGHATPSLTAAELRSYERFVKENRENKNRLKALKRASNPDRGADNADADSDVQIDEIYSEPSKTARHLYHANEYEEENKLNLLAEIEAVNMGLREKLSPLKTPHTKSSNGRQHNGPTREAAAEMRNIDSESTTPLSFRPASPGAVVMADVGYQKPGALGEGLFSPAHEFVLDDGIDESTFIGSLIPKSRTVSSTSLELASVNSAPKIGFSRRSSNDVKDQKLHSPHTSRSSAHIDIDKEISSKPTEIPQTPATEREKLQAELRALRQQAQNLATRGKIDAKAKITTGSTLDVARKDAGPSAASEQRKSEQTEISGGPGNKGLHAQLLEMQSEKKAFVHTPEKLNFGVEGAISPIGRPSKKLAEELKRVRQQQQNFRQKRFEASKDSNPEASESLNILKETAFAVESKDASKILSPAREQVHADLAEYRSALERLRMPKKENGTILKVGDEDGDIAGDKLEIKLSADLISRKMETYPTSTDQDEVHESDEAAGVREWKYDFSSVESDHWKTQHDPDSMESIPIDPSDPKIHPDAELVRIASDLSRIRDQLREATAAQNVSQVQSDRPSDNAKKFMTDQAVQQANASDRAILPEQAIISIICQRTYAIAQQMWNSFSNFVGHGLVLDEDSLPESDSLTSALQRLQAASNLLRAIASLLIIFAFFNFPFGAFSPASFPCWTASPCMLAIGISYLQKLDHLSTKSSVPPSELLLKAQYFAGGCIFCSTLLFITGIITAFGSTAIGGIVGTAACASGPNPALCANTNSSAVSGNKSNGTIITNPSVLGPACMPAAQYADFMSRLNFCSAMLMCSGGEIRITSCSAMLGLNGFESFFTLTSSSGLFLLCMWAYHVFNIRIYEYWGAIQKAIEDPDYVDTFAILSPTSPLVWITISAETFKIVFASLSACFQSVKTLWGEFEVPGALNTSQVPLQSSRDLESPPFKSPQQPNGPASQGHHPLERQGSRNLGAQNAVDPDQRLPHQVSIRSERPGSPTLC